MSELLGGRSITTMTLLRTHLESSAKLCFALEAVTAAARAADVDPLLDIDQQHLFGTSMRKVAGKDPSVAALLRGEEIATLQVNRSVQALDRFNDPTGSITVGVTLYALLCEYAHPNHRGTVELADLSPTPNGGWDVSPLPASQ